MESLPQSPLRIQDIARLAGVSVSTVSRVINNSGYVKKEVRGKVEEIIAQTGFTPSAIAKDLKRQKSSLVGVVIPKINSFTASEMVAGITQTLSARNLSVLLADAENSPEKEADALALFRTQRVNGVLILAASMNEAWQEAVNKLQVPVVVCGQDATAFGVSSVMQNEVPACADLTDYLWRCGHRRIGVIGVGQSDVQIGVERKRGVEKALAKHGAVLDERFCVAAPGFEFRDGGAAVDALLAQCQGELPSALLAVTDRLAIGAMRRLIDLSIRVPEDVSVVGVGDIDLAGLLHPRLTTVHYDYFSTGAEAARLLLDALAAPTPEPVRKVMPYSLKIRETVRNLAY